MTNIAGLILAGGKGTRMGDVDKGLESFRGKPMISHAIERLAPQVDQIIINANRHIEDYKKFGHAVISDIQTNFAGPLAGLEVGMLNTPLPMLLTVPCDSPFLPVDLVERLYQALIHTNANVVYAQTGNQPHPVFALYKTSVLSHLQNFLTTGQRKIRVWHESMKAISVNFDDQERAFSNINTLADLKELETNND